LSASAVGHSITEKSEEILTPDQTTSADLKGWELSAAHEFVEL
jgi:hypothetical protein